MRRARLGLFLVISLTITFPPASSSRGAEHAGAPKTAAGDWPQWGGSPSRNNTPEAENLPAEWDLGKFDYRTGQWLGGSTKNIQWVARLGSESYGSPVIAGGKVFSATNNDAGYVKRYPASVDLGCLLAFDRSDGRFLWQHSVEKLSTRMLDYPKQGICCTPLVEGDRLWVVTNRGQVVCLDTEGFRDGQNDGPFQSEPSEAPDESDVIWTFDMMGRLGSVQHQMACCSVTSAGRLLLASTSNGVDAEDRQVAAPRAPSFIALDKQTGELVWADSSPGENILDGQWGSPAFAVLGGLAQAIFPGGDGWLYSFLAEPADQGKPKLLWKFDCNPKTSDWERGDRNFLIATPVIDDGRVYLATGRDPEEGEGQGDLWCIDPTKRGDVSAELVVDRQGNPVPPRRTQAVDAEAGETVRPNPSSAALWHYRGHDANGDGQHDFEETMHRALGMVAVKDGLLVIGDFAGLVHCLDAKTGRLLWTHDMLAAIWGSPLVADGKIYLGDEDGDLAVFELAPKRNLLAENSMENSVYSAPVVAHNVLYISTRSHLVAIRPASANED
jgi:outer membrane protein assembly factor BamB